MGLPTVYNCGGYERVEVLKMLEGYVDIYMPDAKYASAESAEELSHAAAYPEVARKALREMRRQVGDLVVRNGVAVRGLLVRHLILPNRTDESLAILDFISQEVSPDTLVNVMAQYRPEFHAHDHPTIDRPITSDEYRRVLDHARSLGLRVAE